MKHNLSSTEKENLYLRFLSGEAVNALSAETNIPRSTLYAWFEKHNKEKVIKKSDVSFKNYRILENKVKRLEGIIEILQKAECKATDPLEVKLYVLESLHSQSQYSIHMICEALQIARGAFYNHIFRNKRDHSWYAKRREEFRAKIQQIYDDSNQNFRSGKNSSRYG